MNESGTARDASPVSVFGQIMQRQLEEITAIADGDDDPEAALSAMVLHHLRFALDDRDHLTSWRQEFRSLPSEDAWRLRRMQRLYVEEWAPLLTHMALGALGAAQASPPPIESASGV